MANNFSVKQSFLRIQKIFQKPNIKNLNYWVSKQRVFSRKIFDKKNEHTELIENKRKFQKQQTIRLRIFWVFLATPIVVILGLFLFSTSSYTSWTTLQGSQGIAFIPSLVSDSSGGNGIILISVWLISINNSWAIVNSRIFQNTKKASAWVKNISYCSSKSTALSWGSAKPWNPPEPWHLVFVTFATGLFQHNQNSV